MKPSETTKKSTAKKAPRKAASPEQAPAAPRKDGTVTIFDMKGREVGTFALDKTIFNGEVHKEALYQAVRMYNANRRQGNASTKTRGDVSGGGKKPYRQKGTGRARAGSTRSPLWRHGGVVFGPHPRDYHYLLPKKIRQLAFISSLNVKLNENKLMGIDAVAMTEPKTKNFASMLGALKIDGKALFVLDAVDQKVRLASRNIPGVYIKTYKNFSTMDVLTCDTVVVSKPALEKLSERLAG